MNPFHLYEVRPTDTPRGIEAHLRLLREQHTLIQGTIERGQHMLENYASHIRSQNTRADLLRNNQYGTYVFHTDPENMTIQAIQEQLIAWKRGSMALDRLIHDEQYLTQEITFVESIQQAVADAFFGRCQLCQRVEMVKHLQYPLDAILCGQCYSLWQQLASSQTNNAQETGWFVAGCLRSQAETTTEELSVSEVALVSFLPDNPAFALQSLLDDQQRSVSRLWLRRGQAWAPCSCQVQSLNWLLPASGPLVSDGQGITKSISALHGAIVAAVLPRDPRSRPTAN